MKFINKVTGLIEKPANKEVIEYYKNNPEEFEKVDTKKDTKKDNAKDSEKDNTKDTKKDDKEVETKSKGKK